MRSVFSLLFKIAYKCSFGEFKTKLSLLQHGWSLMVSPDSWLVKSGYVKSFLMNDVVDCSGMALPWMNYSIIRFLDGRLTRELNIFEYGSGNSTLYFSGKVKTVTSIEYDVNWFGLIKSKIEILKLDNVRYFYCSLESNYPASIRMQDQLFDLVVIDGRRRVDCAINALDRLTNKGVVLLDDSNREKYADIFDFYSSNGFSYITFSGLKPTGFCEDFTTIFYRKGENCFNL